MAKAKPSLAKPSASRALARPGDPMVLANGMIIQPDGTAREAEAHTDAEKVKHKPAKFKSTQQRTIKDLPAATNIINACSCIFMYTILGLTDREVAEALNCTVIEVEKIRGLPAYSECFNTVLSEFVNANSTILQSRLAAYSEHALKQTASLSVNADSEGIMLRASQDIMDRAGLGVKQQNNQRLSSLQITIVDAAENKSVGIDINGVG